MFVDILKIAGAICSYLIGGGFASGQELLQYFASYGLWGIGAVAVAFAIMVFCVVDFLKLGLSRNIENAHDAFAYYCGPKIGSCFEFIAFTYLIVQVIVFFTGSGATIAQGFGVSPFVGSAIMGTLVIVTVLLGLNRLIDIVGSLGVLLVVMVVSIVTIFLLKDPTAVVAGSEQVQTMKILQPSSSWAVSGFLYMTFNLLGLAAFMPLLGQRSKNQKINIWGGVLGSAAFCGTIILVMLAFLTDIGNVGTKMVPNLYIANQLHPFLASSFSIVILLGIFTGCTPMYWNFCSRVIPEKNRWFKPFVFVLGCAGVVLGAILPFDKAINVIYQIYGYLGSAFLIFVVWRVYQNHKAKEAK